MQIHRKDDQIQTLEDQLKIEKGENIKTIKKLKEEHDAKEKETTAKMNDVNDRHNSYKKYTDTELKLLK